MNFESVSFNLQVRPNDLDSMGHVNNAIVLEYLETARWAWLQHHNLQSSKTIIPVVVRIEINYRKEILMGNVVINTKLDDSKKLRYQAFFQQSIEIIKEGESLLAVEAKIKVGFIDSNTGKLQTVENFLQDNVRAWKLN